MFNSLCKPARFYLIISALTFIFVLFQNIGATDRVTLGTYSAPHSNPAMILVFNAFYILLWTYMLNLICKINPGISWVIVLFPVILLFVGFAMLLYRGN